MTARARGTFECRLAPLVAYDQDEGSSLARLSIDKRFLGDLEGSSKGEMLSAGAVASGSAGYVAIERVVGTLRGREGTFVLQHSATMARGVPQQTVTVVPDSGTGELAGLSGRMTIEIVDGAHSYDFEYTIAEAP